MRLRSITHLLNEVKISQKGDFNQNMPIYILNREKWGSSDRPIIVSAEQAGNFVSMKQFLDDSINKLKDVPIEVWKKFIWGRYNQWWQQNPRGTKFGYIIHSDSVAAVIANKILVKEIRLNVTFNNHQIIDPDPPGAMYIESKWGHSDIVLFKSLLSGLTGLSGLIGLDMDSDGYGKHLYITIAHELIHSFDPRSSLFTLIALNQNKDLSKLFGMHRQHINKYKRQSFKSRDHYVKTPQEILANTGGYSSLALTDMTDNEIIKLLNQERPEFSRKQRNKLLKRMTDLRSTKSGYSQTRSGGLH